MMKLLSISFLCLAVLFAGLLGITFSLPLQAPALILIGVASLLSVGVVFQGSYDARLLLPVLLSFLYFLLRAVFSPVSDLAMEDLFLILASGLVYLIAGHVMTSARFKLAMIILGLLCLHLVSALIQLAGGEGFSLVGFFTDAVKPEGSVVTGMYYYRGSFANFTMISGILALSLGIWGRFAVWLRVCLCGLASLALVVACLAHSRSAMLGLVVGCLMMMALMWLSVSKQNGKLRSRVRWGVAVLGSAAMVLGVLGVVTVFKSRAMNGKGIEVLFDSVPRLSYWAMAMEQFEDNPVIGAGSRSYSYECFQYWSPNLDMGASNPEFVHNEYLQLLTDYGLIGFLLALTVLLGSLLIGVMRVRLLSGEIRPGGFSRGSTTMALTIAGIVGMVIMMVHIVTDFRTHLLSNLLLFTCCTAWVLPVSPENERGVGSIMNRCVSIGLALTLVVAGLSSLCFGVIQWRGGMPLLQNKMATETGSWDSGGIDIDSWTKHLEQSVQSAPSYRRHLKLGTLYRLKADGLKGAARVDLWNKSLAHFETAASRHPYEPVAKVNLASMYTNLKEYERADVYFREAHRLTSTRDRWFQTGILWADMLRQWAGGNWRQGEKIEARKHYQLALELLQQWGVKRHQATRGYLMVVIEYGRLLDDMQDYEAADSIFETAVDELPRYAADGFAINFRREMGSHYLRKAKSLWYERQPDGAYKELIKARRSFGMHKVVLKGREDKKWENEYSEVEQILKFFKATGVGNEDKGTGRILNQ